MSNPNTPASAPVQDIEAYARSRRDYRHNCACLTDGRVCCGLCFSWKMLARIDELRSDLATLQAKYDVAITRELTANFAAHRETYLKALEAVELMGGILADEACAGKRNAHQFYAAAVAKLREGVTPDTLVAAHAKCSPEELTEVEAAERWVISAAELEHHERPETISPDLQAAVTMLLSARAKGGG